MKMIRSPLSQLYGQGSVEIVTSLDIQNRNVLHLPVLPILLVVWETSNWSWNKRYRSCKKKLNDYNKKWCRIKAKGVLWVMRPRLKVRNLIKYSDHVSLDRDLLILEKALNGKIPEFDASEGWQLPVLIEQYRNRNVDVYLNSAVDRHFSF